MWISEPMYLLFFNGHLRFFIEIHSKTEAFCKCSRWKNSLPYNRLTLISVGSCEVGFEIERSGLPSSLSQTPKSKTH